MWGLPEAGILANKLLQKRLKPHGYHECVNTPGLWRHTTRLITFSLVVNNFGVKYVGKEHADHLISCLKRETYKLTKYLGRGLILRHLAPMGLCGTKARHFDARIHQKSIIVIRTHHAMNTTLPILAKTKKIWRGRTVPPPHKIFCGN